MIIYIWKKAIYNVSQNWHVKKNFNFWYNICTTNAFILLYSNISLEYETRQISRASTWTNINFDVETEHRHMYLARNKLEHRYIWSIWNGTAIILRRTFVLIWHHYTLLSVNMADSGTIVISYTTNCRAKLRRVIHARRHRVDSGTTSWRTRFNLV